jgi:hypothetical protein
MFNTAPTGIRFGSILFFGTGSKTEKAPPQILEDIYRIF